MKVVKLVELTDAERFGLMQLVINAFIEQYSYADVSAIEYAIRYTLENDTFQMSKNPAVDPDKVDEVPDVIWLPTSKTGKTAFLVEDIEEMADDIYNGALKKVDRRVEA